MHYQLNEHFWSIQGEGEHAGRTAVFLRLQGCPVGCEWCDSKLTWYAGGYPVQTTEIPGIVDEHPPSELIVVTGGEPLLYDLDPLFGTLRRQFPEREIHLETSGVFPFKGELRPDWTTLSPKYTRDFDVAPDVLRAADELKYVVDERFSSDVVELHGRQLQTLGRTMGQMIVRLMPEGCPPRRAMVERTLGLLREHPTWRFGPRLQYDYGAITESEGLNNRQVSKEHARAIARDRRTGTKVTASPRQG